MGYKLARKVFILLLLVVAFWFGARFGETKAFEYQIREAGSRMERENSMQQPVILNMQPSGAAAATPAH